MHLRGLDDLSTKDIKAICSEHHDLSIERIEWVDDTSANLVYRDPAVAIDALARLTTTTTTTTIDIAELSSVDLRPMRPSSRFPNSNLQLRIALTTDRKAPRAHETSRFYLLHPEHDPREQRRRMGGRDDSARGYRKRIYSAEEDRKRRQQDVRNGFDASMYDDGGQSPPSATGSSPIRRDHRLVDSYRPIRNRSASPDGQRRQSESRRRRRSPPPARRPRQGEDQSNEHKELLPEKAVNLKTKKELFPNKTGVSNHRRTDAIDAADEAADLFANKFSVPFTDGSNDMGSLASRITRPSQPSWTTFASNQNQKSGRLSPSMAASDDGVRIRGASENGLAIKGGASQLNGVKELFPQRLNTGKELFSDKLGGKRPTRMKAHDLY